MGKQELFRKEDVIEIKSHVGTCLIYKQSKRYWVFVPTNCTQRGFLSKDEAIIHLNNILIKKAIKPLTQLLTVTPDLSDLLGNSLSIDQLLILFKGKCRNGTDEELSELGKGLVEISKLLAEENTRKNPPAAKSVKNNS